MTTEDRYRAFADHEAKGSSPAYEALTRAIADSPALIGLLDELPQGKRQPNLLLAAARMCGAPIDDPPGFIDAVLREWERISMVMVDRSTQTNEAARTATFLPILAQMPGPVALIEVGCSAGLCLYPDRYGIDYDGAGPLVADSLVRIDVATTGPVPMPERLPEVVARIGIDLNPLDVANPDARTWLEALVWPEHSERLARLRAAMKLVAQDPPTLLAGDLVDALGEALGLVPAGATPVVFHSAVLNYVGRSDRRRFAERIAAHPEVWWISNEGPGVLDDVETDMGVPDGASSAAHFLVVLGGRDLVAISDPHGSWIRWA